ncbi:class I poly(R)-hydroxyalkanoic acid synthase [Hyphomonas sp. FCG-A18]|uniref:class I poly(R)-hydroxyalkanoic acid synthase n=1 Tax=Hyphomonas sp. FCG-A18 TaxID=3080019 RepID=UPI002B2A45AD|nr:class I poly(R)-hydroxyalkanoic acid synthase [Hyphomonas sp. FCG-A18]
MTKQFDMNTWLETPLMKAMGDLDPSKTQALTQNLMQAGLEAQALMADMAALQEKAPPAPQRPDPFGALEIQTKLAQAVAARPDRMAQAMMTYMTGWMNLFQSMSMGGELPRDRRFSDPEWSSNPMLDFMRRSWMLNADWLKSLVDAAGDDLTDAERTKAHFFTSQMIDAMSPSNLPASNPAALRAMIETGGESLVQGLRNARADLQRGKGRFAISQSDESAFQLGENIATAEGEVVYRNKLIEIIHYNPTRKKVRERPMLIFPPWINKFYILDLQPENSMIRWLLGQRVNTFLVSWRSADDETKHYTWDDYVEHGVLAALNAVTAETGAKDVNTIGYCIGGTLLTSALAHMAQVGDERIKSATYFASQSDFSNAGELKIFTDEAAIDQIGDVIADHDGMMPGEMMGETFNWLRPADLVWRYVVDNYMMGKQPKPFDLLYWNADQTNIPGPTHQTYLKSLYNENALSEGNFEVFGHPVSMGDIDVPVFIQASRSDHICPWHSIYRGAQNFGGDVRFTLAGSGHIAGVINHPNANKYQHWVNHDLPDNPGNWLSHAEEIEGSWWPSWWNWLKPLCGDKIEATPPKKHKLGKAPGQYAKMRLADIAAGKKPKGPYSDGTSPSAAPAKKPSYRMPAGRRQRS